MSHHCYFSLPCVATREMEAPLIILQKTRGFKCGWIVRREGETVLVKKAAGRRCGLTSSMHVVFHHNSSTLYSFLLNLGPIYIFPCLSYQVKVIPIDVPVFPVPNIAK